MSLRSLRGWGGFALLALTACGGAAESDDGVTDEGSQASIGSDMEFSAPVLHHTGLNTVDAEAAIEWYLKVWPTAERSQVDGKPAVRAEMFLVFNEVSEPPPGAFDPDLGRPAEQSAFWHIGAFANTTNDRARLAEVDIEHLPLRVGPNDQDGVWRSGLTPYAGIQTVSSLEGAEAAEPREGGFSYLLAPDGVLFELTGGANTRSSMSHIHFFREEPQCAANWYVDHLGMTLPPIRNEDGTRSERPPYSPCEAERGDAGWPSLEMAGTIRQPRGTVVFGNGSMGWYPRQCIDGRCGADRPLVPTRGQVLDHVAFTVVGLDAWYERLRSQGVRILEEPAPFGDTRAFMIEDPDGLAIELIEAAGAPDPVSM